MITYTSSHIGRDGKDDSKLNKHDGKDDSNLNKHDDAKYKLSLLHSLFMDYLMIWQRKT